MRRVRWFIDRQGDLTVEWAVASLLEDGELGRHLRRVRRHYAERQEALLAALEAELGESVSFRRPPGGMALWVRDRQKSGPATEAWAARALDAGVLVHPARRFDFENRALPYLRLGFAALTPEEIRRAVRTLARAR